MPEFLIQVFYSFQVLNLLSTINHRHPWLLRLKMAAPIQSLHVLDLPQLYQKPSAEIILAALDKLKLEPPSWNRRDANARTDNLDGPQSSKIIVEGNLAGWLTGIISSQLLWIDDEEERERVWSIASLRISERCGRTARPAATRKFVIPASAGALQPQDMEINLHEPTMEGDNLGLKTWASSYQVATLFSRSEFIEKLVGGKNKMKVLELGAGTGLLGIAAALALPPPVELHLTDLPEIVPNLQKNISLNFSSFPSGTTVTGGVLDWRLQTCAPSPQDKFNILLAADSVYSKEHPSLISDVVVGWMERSSEARCVVGLPFRSTYRNEVEDFWSQLKERGLALLEEGEQSGWDDWGEGDQGQEVKCWWGIFGWSERCIHA